MSSGELLCSIVFDIGVTTVAMDAAEQSFFAGCADGSIYQVELFRRVSTLVLSVTNAMLTKTVQGRSISCCGQMSGTTQCLTKLQVNKWKQNDCYTAWFSRVILA